jgi:hypothetical protein
VDTRTGLDDVGRRKCLTLPGLELRHLCRPARSQSLYRLRYPGSLHAEVNTEILPLLKIEPGTSSPEPDLLLTEVYLIITESREI